MRFYTYLDAGREALAVAHQGAPNTLYPISQFGLSFSDMTDLVEHITEDEMATLKAVEGKEGLPLSEVTLLAPIVRPRQDVICLGLNYSEHAKEIGDYLQVSPAEERRPTVYFSKRVNEAVPPEGYVLAHEDIVDSLDYEVELAVVLGKDAVNVKAEDAYSYVFGYTILNDISARTIQHRHKQWYFGKSLDGFTPMGPCIVTADEFALPLQLNVQSRVNGEVRQNSNTALFIADIPCVLQELTKGMTLKAGTIISMGTPVGVGFGFDPPRYLVPGDVVECEIEGIGILRNTIK